MAIGVRSLARPPRHVPRGAQQEDTERGTDPVGAFYPGKNARDQECSHNPGHRVDKRRSPSDGLGPLRIARCRLRR